jgi:predicted Zn-dependent protease
MARSIHAAGPRLRRSVVCVVAALATANCASVQTTNPGTIGVDRRQQMMISQEQIDEGAAKAYAQELDKARSGGTLNRPPALLRRVKQIAARLIPQTAIFRPEAPRWKWQVNVQDTPELNAYCMPGGKIMVYSGLASKLQLSDAELSAVIGHEMAHALREHTRERMSRAYAQQMVLAGVAIVAGAGQGTMDLASQVATVTFQLPHSREQEEEADRIGLELMARAGYDPNAAVSVWTKMANAQQGAPPQFLSTHPSTGSRIKDLQAHVPVVMPLYAAAARRP